VTHDPTLEPVTRRFDHEPLTTPLRPLAVGAIVVASLTGFALVASLWLFDFLGSGASAQRGHALDHPLAAERETPPAPRLEADPAASLVEQRRLETERLSGYRWVDRSAGVVAIPIERAMELLAAEGLPVAPPPEER
jgi:hypothetical protein